MYISFIRLKVLFGIIDEYEKETQRGRERDGERGTHIGLIISRKQFIV